MRRDGGRGGEGELSGKGRGERVCIKNRDNIVFFSNLNPYNNMCV